MLVGVLFPQKKYTDNNSHRSFRTSPRETGILHYPPLPMGDTTRTPKAYTLVTPTAFRSPTRLFLESVDHSVTHPPSPTVPYTSYTPAKDRTTLARRQHYGNGRASTMSATTTTTTTTNDDDDDDDDVVRRNAAKRSRTDLGASAAAVLRS